MTAICAKGTADVDEKRSCQSVPVDLAEESDSEFRRYTCGLESSRSAYTLPSASRSQDDEPQSCSRSGAVK
jgi:hypothetical protein